ncbi:hypothetical protein H2201_003168 [Coniosporium apollinis]|uniref:Low temperature requirement A n=1 Tax=Coniosporium apollinis TaxID=61459 RepID=A0ABQ9NWJ9_9PEZI|nr:hypothetical protein H2201_003168 [Coniosporium apollinis]
MGFSILRRNGSGDNVNPDRLKRRKHHLVPWIENPCKGADVEELVFHQRHEANTVELFFDLFFVANLATFTAYHSITDNYALYAYIGFFAIIWSTWFQITLHDVRFARDCVYERFCKTMQMIAFVGFALVGSKFTPGSKKGNNTNFRVLCYTLVLSRALFTVQYSVVLVGSIMKNYNKLILPLSLNIALNAAAAATFGAMTPAFADEASTHELIYGVWWIVIFVEAAGTIAIASCWRTLSFKKTHLVERMALLTLIVIGEGAIGVTKTIARMMGKYGLDPEGTMLVVTIILILVFLWMLYFDNHPHYHYGTIRQQFWSALHFPFHLAIVGVVEGSQQIALAHYVFKSTAKLMKDIEIHCTIQQLEGVDLINALNKSVEYFQLNTKIESLLEYKTIQADLRDLAQYEGQGLCSPEYTSQFNTTNEAWPFNYPPEFGNLTQHTYGGIYASLGIKLDWQKNIASVAISAFRTTYIYYWSAMLVLLACMMVFLYLIRRNRMDVFDWVAQIVRALLFGLAAVMLILARSDATLTKLLESPALVPLVAIMLFLLVLSDRMSKSFSNWRLKRSGQEFVDDDDDEEEEEEEEHHGLQQLHDHGKEHDDQHEEREEKQKQEPQIMVQEMTGFDTNTGYSPVPQTAVFPQSPPTPMAHYDSPMPQLRQPHGGGYEPVDNGQYGP